MRNLRVLLVDDNEKFLRAARGFLNECCRAEVIASARRGEEVLALIDGLRPDVVLIDLVLEGINGLAVATQIAERADPPAVILVSLHQPCVYWDGDGALPIRAFVPKQRFCEEIQPLLERISAALPGSQAVTRSGQ